MRIALVMLAMAVALGVFASNPSVTQAASKGPCTKQTIECPPFEADESSEYDIGRVIALDVFFGAHQVQVLTTGKNFTLTVPKDLWDRLDIGDVVLLDSDGLHLLRKVLDPERGKK